MSQSSLNKIRFTEDISRVIDNCKSVVVPKSREELVSMALFPPGANSCEVSYDVNGEVITEATVVRCKNGVAINYMEDYMRRRDPDCTIVSDDGPTDKPRFIDRFNEEFTSLREQTLNWLADQELVVVPFLSGGTFGGYHSVLISPVNAAFFAAGLAELQYFINIDEFEGEFEPKLAVFMAPPFRHTYFDGKQIIVHNRLPDIYEMFSYNLYPGPSAKKGVYGFLLDVGEREGWITAHASAVKITTPYENEIVFMHEGASGGGKSETGERIHREIDGRVMYAQHILTGEKSYLKLEEECQLSPIADDMVLCHPRIQNDSGKLVIRDAEDGWFLRLDHVTQYGTEPLREKIFTQPSEPLVFLNMQAVPLATCLVWEHTIDSDGRPCTNPRVILPRRMIPDVISDPIEVDVRSFGIRTPPCTAERPSYGIMGMLQILPPALAWLWRLVAPRGHNNPSIIETKGITSEGIGSYGPFLTGKSVTHANLFLKQILNSLNTRYVLIPNQHIGCYKVGFMPQWLMREYLARRGNANFKLEKLSPARLPILGYCPESLKIDGQYINKVFLRPETQPEIGISGYDEGSKQLTDFCKEELLKYYLPVLDPLGKRIIDCCLNDAPLEEYVKLIPYK